MRKHIVISIGIAIIVILLCSCSVVIEDKDNNTSTTMQIEIASSSFSNGIYDLSADSNSIITINKIADDELIVVRNNAEAITRGVSLNNSLISSQTGNTILFCDDDGNCSFRVSDLDVGNETAKLHFSKLPVLRIDSSNLNDPKIKVVDANGKENGKIYIPNSECGYYYVDERVLYVDLEDIRNNLPEFSYSKCVISRVFQYVDGALAEDPNYIGIHNTRNTYGIITADKEGHPTVVNSGVIDLSETKSLKLYAGFASNVIMGSGMTVCVLPVTVVAETPITINDMDAIFGLENLPRKKYALEVSNLDTLVAKNFYLNTTSTEIRSYSGSKLPSGYPLNYLEGDDSFLYYLGEIEGDVYVSNSMRNTNHAGYNVRLVEISDEQVEEFTIPKQNTLILEVNVGISDDVTMTSENGVITYRRTSSDASPGKSGQLTCALTGFGNNQVSYQVRFQHWDFESSTWQDTEYNESQISCIINYASTGNQLMENSVSANNGTMPVRMMFNNITRPARAIITFDD